MIMSDVAQSCVGFFLLSFGEILLSEYLTNMREEMEASDRSQFHIQMNRCRDGIDAAVFLFCFCIYQYSFG